MQLAFFPEIANTVNGSILVSFFYDALRQVGWKILYLTVLRQNCFYILRFLILDSQILSSQSFLEIVDTQHG